MTTTEKWLRDGGGRDRPYEDSNRLYESRIARSLWTDTSHRDRRDGPEVNRTMVEVFPSLTSSVTPLSDPQPTPVGIHDPSSPPSIQMVYGQDGRRVHQSHSM